MSQATALETTYKSGLLEETPDKILNITMNFAKGSSINNVKFKYPTNPLYHNKDRWGWTKCPEKIPDEGAFCTQVMDIEVGDLVELR